MKKIFIITLLILPLWNHAFARNDALNSLIQSSYDSKENEGFATRERVEMLETFVSEVPPALKDIRSLIENQNEKIDEFKAEFDQLRERQESRDLEGIEALTLQFENINQRLGQFEEELEKIDERVGDFIQAQEEEFDLRFQAIEETLESMKSMINQLDGAPPIRRP